MTVLAIQESVEFSEWMQSLADDKAAGRIQMRIARLKLGNPGDVEPVGHGVSEMRIDHGPGYRVYFVQRGQKLIVVLGGGTESTQTRDIKRAILLAGDL